MSDISARLAKLSPEQRKLLELLTERETAFRQGSDTTSPERAVPSHQPLLQTEHFSTEQPGFIDAGSVQRFYDTVSQQLDASPFAPYALFLNYGYVPNGAPQHSRIKLPNNYLNKNATQLILEVLGDCDFRPEHDVLEVGCGRGGFCHVLRTFLKVRRYLGIDLSPVAIAHCQRTHRWPDTEFMKGNAEHLPAEDNSFDAVANVESSHCYPDIFAFYREVHRVLRPGGWFLYTDLIARDLAPRYEHFLQGLGFTLERRQDITRNVLLSCDETATAHQRAFHQGNDSQLMAAFLGQPGSRIYDEMSRGQQLYLLYRFRKPA